jgi:hypothetical protein
VVELQLGGRCLTVKKSVGIKKRIFWIVAPIMFIAMLVLVEALADVAGLADYLSVKPSDMLSFATAIMSIAVTAILAVLVYAQSDKLSEMDRRTAEMEVKYATLNFLYFESIKLLIAGNLRKWAENKPERGKIELKPMKSLSGGGHDSFHDAYIQIKGREAKKIPIKEIRIDSLVLNICGQEFHSNDGKKHLLDVTDLGNSDYEFEIPCRIYSLDLSSVSEMECDSKLRIKLSCINIVDVGVNYWSRLSLKSKPPSKHVDENDFLILCFNIDRSKYDFESDTIDIKDYG